jgi:hypothetical protein
MRGAQGIFGQGARQWEEDTEAAPGAAKLPLVHEEQVFCKYSFEVNVGGAAILPPQIPGKQRRQGRP